MDNYTGILRHGAEDLEIELSGIEAGTKRLTPEVAKAIEGVMFIAEHLKEEDDANNVRYGHRRGYRRMRDVSREGKETTNCDQSY